MKLISFARGGARGFGAWVEDGIVDLSTAPEFQHYSGLKAAIEALGTDQLVSAIDGLEVTYAHEEIDLDIPIPDAGRILCVGINYKARPGEYGASDAPKRPSLFVRFPSSLAAHGNPLLRPAESPQLDYEGEIAIVIGKAGRRIAPKDALSHIAGYSCFNEGTIRDWVRHGVYNVTAGKNWYQSGAMGPWVVTTDAIPNPHDMTIETYVNGKSVQSDNTSNMIFPFEELISYISTFTPLSPGDVIATGTPTGAGGKMDPPRYLSPGDEVEVRVGGVGSLANKVADEVAP